MFRLVYYRLLTAVVLSTCFCSSAGGADYLGKIKSRKDFNSLSSPSFLSTSFNLPSLMFVMDKMDDRIYYINSKKYPIQLDFINSQYLSLSKGKTFIENQLDNDRRRFIMGFIVERKPSAFTLEFWVDDVMSSDMFRAVFKKVEKTFFSKILFNPLTESQMAVMVNNLSDIPVVKNPVYQSAGEYQMINTGKSFGKLIISEDMKEGLATEFGNIAVIKYTPKSLMGVTGFVSSKVMSALSHVCILARTIKIPAFYMPDAGEKLAAFKDKYVEFEVKRDTYSIKLSSYEKVNEYLKSRISKKKYSPQADLEFKEIIDLKKQKGHDSVRFGAKSSNLGQVANFGIKGFKIPEGFTVPFHYYGSFARENGIIEYINEALDTPSLYTDFKFRKERLRLIREKIQKGKISPELRAKVFEKLKRFKGKGVFVRSSTNAEDLPNFTGAGLYTTVPNIKGIENVLEAIKTVWASIYNDRAFDAREVFGIEHKSVLPAVLIQEGMDADMAGVMFTKSDAADIGKDCVEIAAKRGLGIRVVEGHKAPERLIYCPRTDELKVLNLSKDDIMIKFEKDGGVKQVQTEESRPALNPVLAKKLAKIGLEIEKGFGSMAQDIEWLIIGDTVYIVQSRPYKF